MYNLSGKVALVTGAGGMRTVGRAVAERLAREGADLALTDILRGPEDLPEDELQAGWRGLASVADAITTGAGPKPAQKAGRRVLTHHADLRSAEEVGTLVQRTLDTYGRIDILVNTHRAIIGRDYAPVTELDEDQWRHTVEVNATSCFLTIKYVAREMVRLGIPGRVVSIASNAAKQASAGGAAYAASKFALLGLTQSAALDLAPNGILVNAVCPGPIDTNRLNYHEREEARAQGINSTEYHQRQVEGWGRALPLGRTATPDDVADMVTWLVSDQAGYITGQAFNLNGGLLFH